MGTIVKLKDVPESALGASRYDGDIDQALKMGEDEALKIAVPADKDHKYIHMALAHRIKTRECQNKLHVRSVKGELYILHGAMKAVKQKHRASTKS